jgi:hypothetical protein
VAEAYTMGWAAMTRLMLEGHSWSGRERNNCFVNLGDGTFADVSFASGLDFADDGRAVAVVDWDGDGDLDLWMRNRTGPQLRLMRNDGAGDGHWVSFLLEGTTSNRDAVGAAVELRTRKNRRLRPVVAGDGYLSQSSRRVHFGLGDERKIESVVVRWPGGESEEIQAPKADGRYVVRQGTGKAVRLDHRSVQLAAMPQETPPAQRLTRVLLREPLPMPPTVMSELHGGPGRQGRSTLINLWAHWCEPCFEELGHLADRYDEVHAAGLDVMPISADVPADFVRAKELFAGRIAGRMSDPSFDTDLIDAGLREIVDALLEFVLGSGDELKLPTSLLVDGMGRLKMIYVGPVGVDAVLEDKRRFIDEEMPLYKRSLYDGRWYFRTRRNLSRLVNDLRDREMRDDSRYYLGLWKFGEIERGVLRPGNPAAPGTSGRPQGGGDPDPDPGD